MSAAASSTCRTCFPAGGVGEFTVSGIDPSAGIDPTNGLAFVTGLSFVCDGSFTGTMTPITARVAVAVPEPGTFWLLAFGLAGLGFLSLEDADPHRRPSPASPRILSRDAMGERGY